MLDNDVSRVLVRQAILAGGAAAVALAAVGPGVALAVLYGGAVALVSSLMLGHSVQKACVYAPTAHTKASYSLFIGLFERLALVVVLIVLGLKWLKLGPLPLIAGFAVAQLAYAVAFSRPLQQKGVR
ncbi:MAG: ATP synthase subunit I [Burkholderiales bacterium]